MDIQLMRSLVENYYDIQDMRLRAFNRARAYMKAKDYSEEEIENSENDIKQKLKTVFGFSWLLKAPQISILLSIGMIMLALENVIKSRLAKEIKGHILWEEWLKGVSGIGAVLAANLIANIEDIRNYATISKLWRDFGLAVFDGRAERRVKGEKTHFDPRKKQVYYKIGDCFVKSGKGYRDLYVECREEYDQKWKTPKDCGSVGCKNKGEGKCMDGHKYAAAKRKTVKIFLAHLHQKWSELEENIPIKPFIIGRNNHEHEIPIIYK